MESVNTFDVKRFTKLKLFTFSIDGDLEGVVDALGRCDGTVRRV